MRSGKLRILFVSHEASRSGAPMMLLHVVSGMRGCGEVDFEVALWRGGELESDFAAVGPAHVIQRDRPKALRRLGLARLTAGVRDGLLRRRFAGFDLIYLNSVASLPFLDWLGPADLPVVLHAHELDSQVEATVGREGLEPHRPRLTRVVACSRAVRKLLVELVERLGFEPGCVDVVHEFIDADALAGRGDLDAGALRRELGLPPGAFVVGGAGQISFRKGPDLFVQLAAEVRRREPATPVHFVWVGHVQNQSVASLAKLAANALGVADRVHFVGQKRDPFTAFRSFDLFAMVSREDPFPLVTMEAGALGIPVLCFAGAGGTPELLRGDAGVVVPYLDVGAMAEEVIRLLRDSAFRTRMGHALRERVLREHNITVGVNSVLASIRRAAGEVDPANAALPAMSPGR
jgi:glycosyltransferase involved in cell wall biosynthesis